MSLSDFIASLNELDLETIENIRETINHPQYRAHFDTILDDLGLEHNREEAYRLLNGDASTEEFETEYHDFDAVEEFKQCMEKIASWSSVA